MRGYFGVGIWHGKTEMNLGTLWRSAHCFGAQFIFAIGKRYKKQSSDTTKAFRHIPLFEFTHFDGFYDSMIPYDCQVIGIEITEGNQLLNKFVHPDRCIYLLGAEDHGLSQEILSRCHKVVQIPSVYCLNVAVAGSIVMYDRILKRS